MSDFKFSCPKCLQHIAGEQGHRGSRIECPSCGHKFTIPLPPPKAVDPESRRKMSALALVSFVSAFGLLAGGLVAVVCGHLAKARLKKDPTLRGARLATAGLAIGYFMVVGSAVAALGILAAAPPTGRQIPAQMQEAEDAAALKARLVDEVKPGDPQSELDHEVRHANSGSAVFMDRPLRHAFSGGFIAYKVKVLPDRPVTVRCTYWGNESTQRRFDVIVEDQVVATQTLEFNDPGRFFAVDYDLPEKLTRGKTNALIVFQAYPNNTAGGIFGLQVLKR